MKRWLQGILIGCGVLLALVILLAVMAPGIAFISLKALSDCLPMRGEIAKHAGRATWSNDGRNLYFVRFPRDYQPREGTLYRYDVEKRRKYVVGPYRDFCAISPDERAILLLPDDGKSLTVLDLETGRRREIRSAAQPPLDQCCWQGNGWIGGVESIEMERYRMQYRIWFFHPDTGKTFTRRLPTYHCIVSQNSPHSGYFDEKNAFHYIEIQTGHELYVLPGVGDQTGQFSYRLEKNRLYRYEIDRADQSRVNAYEYDLTTGVEHMTKYTSRLNDIEGGPYTFIAPNHHFIATIYSGGADWYNSFPNNLCVSQLKPMTP